jgi:hypothetical protein
VLNDQTQVSGVVRDAETLAPLAGAEVQSNPATELAITDAEGRYTLTAKLGVRYQVSAAQDGYRAVSLPFTPTLGAPNVLDFALPLVAVCTPAARRCLAGAAEAAVQVCGPRGNLWEDQPCAEGEGCDPRPGRCAVPRSASSSSWTARAASSAPSRWTGSPTPPSAAASAASRTTSAAPPSPWWPPPWRKPASPAGGGRASARIRSAP